MEQKPNENRAEAKDDGLFTSATRVQIPLGTQENQAVSSESAEQVSGDRRGDSADPDRDAALEREFQSDLDGVMNRISLMSGRAKVHGHAKLFYALNRAWHEIDKGRRS